MSRLTLLEADGERTPQALPITGYGHNALIKLVLTVMADCNDELGEPYFYRNNNGGRLSLLGQETLRRTILEQELYALAQPMKVLANGTEVPTKWPTYLFKVLLDSPPLAETQLDTITAVVNQPYLDASGNFIDKPGLCKETGIYLTEHDFVERTLDDSLAIIKTALAEVNFAGLADHQDWQEHNANRANTVAAMLAPHASQFTGVLPIFSIDKPGPRSGASSLARAVLAASGETDKECRIPTFKPGRNGEEEFSKSMPEWLQRQNRNWYMDNLNCRLDSADLASLTSEGVVVVRRLGGNETFTGYANGRQLVTTSNHGELSEELAERAVLTELAMLQEDMSNYDWQCQDYKAYIAANLKDLRDACLSIVKHTAKHITEHGYLVKPPTFANFQGYANFIAEALALCGINGFLANHGKARQDNSPYVSVNRRFLQELFDRSECAGAELERDDLLRDAVIANVIEEGDSWWKLIPKLANIYGKPYYLEDGKQYRLVKYQIGHGGRNRWKLDLVGAVTADEDLTETYSPADIPEVA